MENKLDKYKCYYVVIFCDYIYILYIYEILQNFSNKICTQNY